jgi:hypothetical protein
MALSSYRSQDKASIVSLMLSVVEARIASPMSWLLRVREARIVCSSARMSAITAAASILAEFGHSFVERPAWGGTLDYILSTFLENWKFQRKVEEKSEVNAVVAIELTAVLFRLNASITVYTTAVTTVQPAGPTITHIWGQDQTATGRTQGPNYHWEDTSPNRISGSDLRNKGRKNTYLYAKNKIADISTVSRALFRKEYFTSNTVCNLIPRVNKIQIIYNHSLWIQYSYFTFWIQTVCFSVYQFGNVYA